MAKFFTVLLNECIVILLLTFLKTCILYIWHVAAATVCPCMAYHILNTSHSVVQQLLFDPLWPTIFWILPIQLYSSYCLSVYGPPYSEYYLLSFTATAVCPCMAYHVLNNVHSVWHDFYVSVCWPYSSYIYARTSCKMLIFTLMYVHLDCLLFSFLCF